jgi:hypothetical protein
MNQAAQLAGFLAAHAVLQVAKGTSLGPIIIFEKSDGTSRIIGIKCCPAALLRCEPADSLLPLNESSTFPAPPARLAIVR